MASRWKTVENGKTASTINFIDEHQVVELNIFLRNIVCFNVLVSEYLSYDKKIKGYRYVKELSGEDKSFIKHVLSICKQKLVKVDEKTLSLFTKRYLDDENPAFNNYVAKCIRDFLYEELGIQVSSEIFYPIKARFDTNQQRYWIDGIFSLCLKNKTFYEWNGYYNDNFFSQKFEEKPEEKAKKDEKKSIVLSYSSTVVKQWNGNVVKKSVQKGWNGDVIKESVQEGSSSHESQNKSSLDLMMEEIAGEKNIDGLRNNPEKMKEISDSVSQIKEKAKEEIRKFLKDEIDSHKVPETTQERLERLEKMFEALKEEKEALKEENEALKKKTVENKPLEGNLSEETERPGFPSPFIWADEDEDDEVEDENYDKNSKTNTITAKDVGSTPPELYN